MLEKMLKIADVSSMQLSWLVEDILDLAKFDANKFQFNISDFYLKDIVEAIDYMFKFQCNEKGLDFNIVWDQRILDQKLRSDPMRIKQVLINLVSNSLKFTQEGRINVTVGFVYVLDIRLIVFEVCDTGIGISKEDQEHLFVMFGVLNNARHVLNQNGTGIGLSVSKKLVESLGGYIKVESREGSWTKFTFTIEDKLHNSSRNQEEDKVA